MPSRLALVLGEIIEKCGGPGSGVPGPCPGPKKPKSPKKPTKPTSKVKPRKSVTGKGKPLTPEERRKLIPKAVKRFDNLEDVTSSEEFMVDSLVAYTGNGYKVINSWLRKGKGSFAPIVGLDRLFRNAESVPRDTVVFRGNSSGRFRDLKPGDEFRDKGFVSSSIDSRVAKEFSGGGRGTVFRIRVKKGTRVVAPSDDGEGEVILPRGSRFRVLSVKKGIVEVEHLGAEE